MVANRYLLLILICGFILAPVRSGKTEVTFLDVGQGDGIFISASGENILVDCGSSSDKKVGENVIEPFLKSRGIGHLDKVFVTHADNDHTSGILYLLDESDIEIEKLYLPAQAEKDEEYAEFRQESSEKPSARKIEYIAAGDRIKIGENSIYCLSPDDDAHPSDMNDQSLVLLYREGVFGLLLMGDAGKEAEREMLKNVNQDIGNISVLKVGHHGSKSSTSEELLDATDPLYAILSYGEGNRYGHPNAETVELLEDYGIRCERTADSGALTFTLEGNKMRLRRFIE